MAKHVTYRGTTIDMESIRREHEKTPALGNMKVNARGDQLACGTVTKTAEQIARDNHRVQSTIVATGLKGPVPDSDGINMAPSAKAIKTAAGASKAPKVTETELPSGDIIIESDKDES